MKREEVREIIECLGGDKKIFHYFKERHLIELLLSEMEDYCESTRSICDLKKSKYAGLLQSSLFKEHADSFGNGAISSQDLKMLWPKETQPFVLDLDLWGSGDRGWDQTSRNQSNLVLRLNFTESMNRKYQRLVKPTDHCGPFESWCHPVRTDRRKTMSWIRMDIDFNTGEALIEEIQNDWLRGAKSSLTYLRKKLEEKPYAKPYQIDYELGGSFKDIEHYVEEILKPYFKTWADASMLAALNFLKKEIGISDIYYHTYDTGKKIKQAGTPPKSLYTTLPKKYGFKLVCNAPRFIYEDKTSRRYLKAIKNPRWYRLVQ